jgi:hypothetical protein
VRGVEDIAAVPGGRRIHGGRHLAGIVDMHIRYIYANDSRYPFQPEGEGISTRSTLQVNGQLAPIAQFA